jgi:DNA-binding response OmpR family regulator
MLRRPRTVEPSVDVAVRRFGELEIDPRGREVRVDARPIELTRTEFDLLDTLSAEPHMVFSRRQLLEHVWGADWYGDDHVIDVHVGNLRRKLGDDASDPRYIRTVRGVGYRMGVG